MPLAVVLPSGQDVMTTKDGTLIRMEAISA
jgi:hypothetical protein